MIGWIRAHPRLLALYLLFLLLVLLVTAPMRFAFTLVPGAVAARSAEHQLVSGVVRDLSVGGVPIGDIRADLSPLALLLLRVSYHVFRPATLGVDPVEARASVSPIGTRIADLNAVIALPSNLGPVPISAVVLRNITARFASGRCITASGMVQARLAPSAAALASVGQLSGSARCEAGRVLVPLVSASGNERIALRLSPSGSYEAEVTLRAAPPELGPALAALGFAPAAGGQRLVVRGRF